MTAHGKDRGPMWLWSSGSALSSAGRDPCHACDGVSGGDGTFCTRDVYDDAGACSRGSTRGSTSRSSLYRDISGAHGAVRHAAGRTGLCLALCVPDAPESVTPVPL